MSVIYPGYSRCVWRFRLVSLIALVVAFGVGDYVARRLIGSNAAVTCGLHAAGWRGAVTGRIVPATRPVMERAIEADVNTFRVQHGVARLVHAPNLAFAARYHSADELAHHYFDHTRPGEGFTTRFARYSPSQCVAENIAEGYTTARGVVTAWQRSPEHRHVMLLTWVTRIGVGIAGHQITADFSG